MRLKTHLFFISSVFLVSAGLLCSCDLSSMLGQKTASSSSAASITSFTILQSSNTAIASNITATVNTSSLIITIPLPANVYNNQTLLVPSIALSPGARISPLSSVAQNFRNPVTYVVTSSDGSLTQTYITASGISPVTISSDASILSFSFQSSLNSALTSTIQGTIDSTANIIYFGLPSGIFNSNGLLTPSIQVSPYATISTLGPMVFNVPVQYVVTASDGTTTVVWTTSPHLQSSVADIVSFTFTSSLNPALSSNVSSTINHSNHSISFTLPASIYNNSTSLIPTITVSPYAKLPTIQPQQYTSSQTIVVTAEDGTTQSWSTSAAQGN